MSEVNWRIGHLDHLESPWGNAGGVVKSVEDVEAMAKTGVGWIEAGSYTLEPRLGNQYNPETGELRIDPDTDMPIEVYRYINETGEMFNSLGMPNKGIDEVSKEIPEMVRTAEAYGKKLIVNVAPVSKDPVAETQELVQRVYKAGAHGVIVNGGCPNVEVDGGKREEALSLNAAATYMVLSGLGHIVKKYAKVMFRGTPQPSLLQAKTVYQSIERAGTVSTIFIPNSWGGVWLDRDGKSIIKVPGGISGKTGPAMSKQAFEQVEMAARIFNGSGIDVVVSSGIANSEPLDIRAAKQLRKALDLGAVAAAGSTFYFVPERGWAEDTDKMLREFAEL